MSLPFIPNPPKATPAPGSLAGLIGSATGPAPIGLLDVVRTNGDSFHWANAPFTTAPIYTGNTPSPLPAAALLSPPPVWDNYYFPWLLNADGMHFYRTIQADSATFVVQNISGNSIGRDVAAQLRAATFEGALFAFRIWYPAAQAAGFEYHGRLSVTGAGEMQCQFGTSPLFDESNYDGNPYEYSETCQWTYAHPGCDDTTDNPCQNTYSTCRQTNRFLGVLNTFQINLGNGDSLAQIQTAAVNRMRMF